MKFHVHIYERYVIGLNHARQKDNSTRKQEGTQPQKIHGQDFKTCRSKM